MNIHEVISEVKKINPNSTVFKFYDSKNKMVNNVRFTSSGDSEGFRTLDITGNFGEDKLFFWKYFSEDISV